MVAKRKLGGLMLTASHAFHATLAAPFTAAGWQAPDDSSFGVTNINSISRDESSGKYVAVGDAGKVGFSIDNAFSWQQAPSPAGTTNLYSIHHANGLYVVGGSTGRLMTSSDGEFWTLRNSGFGASPILGATYLANQSLWVIVGGAGKLATSPDGATWTLRSSSFGSTYINKVYSSQSISIAVGYEGKLATSTDGISWTQRNSSFVFDTIFDVTSNTLETQYVAVGDFGKVATSADGISWTQVFPGTSFGSTSIKSISKNEEIYAACGSVGKIGTSTTATSWTQRNSNLGATTLNDIYVSEFSAVVVGDNGQVVYSV